VIQRRSITVTRTATRSKSRSISFQQKKDHKRYHQFTRDFGGMSEANFDSDAPDYTWLDREEVRRLVKEGHL